MLNESFHSKSLESFYAAELCENNQLFSSYVNPYYYGFLQLILQILEQNGINLDEDKLRRGSTHEKTMQEFLNLVLAKGEKKKVLDSFKASFKILKRYRVKLIIKIEVFQQMN